MLETFAPNYEFAKKKKTPELIHLIKEMAETDAAADLQEREQRWLILLGSVQ